jgi:hypothetical protein
LEIHIKLKTSDVADINTDDEVKEIVGMLIEDAECAFLVKEYTVDVIRQ